MAIMQTLDEQLARIATGNRLYTYNKAHWKFLLESYLGGDDYRRGGHLTRYATETDVEYNARLQSTPLENHCNAVINVYNSFLFKEKPERTFNGLEVLPEVEDFLDDCDLDDRDLDSFMKDVSTWASVYGHCWVIVAKPNIGAVTKADELAAGVRPYVNLLTPLSVLDWHWQRNECGVYTLMRLKYIEDINGSIQTIKEWTPETITTWNVDFDNRLIISEVVEDNGLGKIPAVVAYNTRSPIRGLGKSDISDIADLQRFIYNCTSEVEQTLRLDSHPSLVKTPETQAGAGAGSIIHMPENMDPGLKPYLLEYNGGSTTAIYAAIQHATDTIDTLSNTGSVRGTSAKILSGIAMQTEFQLLNAKLSEKADNLEEAEEKIWKLFFEYQGQEWVGDIHYEDSYSIQDEESAYIKLQTAKSAATSPMALAYIDSKLVTLLHDDLAPEEIDDLGISPQDMMDSMNGANNVGGTMEDNQASIVGPGADMGTSAMDSAGSSLIQQTTPANNSTAMQPQAMKGNKSPGSKQMANKRPITPTPPNA